VGTFVTVFWDTDLIHHHLPEVLARRDAIFPALIASVFCLVVVSACTAPPRREQIAPFFPATEPATGEPVSSEPVS
jgi:SSS family solute:Na+ symporter/sodium/proline symporter